MLLPGLPHFQNQAGSCSAPQRCSENCSKMNLPAVACSSLLRVCSITARPCPSAGALAVALNSHRLSYDACTYLLDPAWRQFS